MPVMRRLDATRGDLGVSPPDSWRSMFSLGDRVGRAGESRKPAARRGWLARLSFSFSSVLPCARLAKVLRNPQTSSRDHSV